MCMLSDMFTYCSDSGANTSWIDHVITSHAVNSCISDISVLYDYTCSDHRPLSVNLSCVSANCSNVCNAVDVKRDAAMHDWTNIDASVLGLYMTALDTNLADVIVPDCLRNCCNKKCNNAAHKAVIDSYYSGVIECVKQAIDYAIPTNTSHINEYNIPGWNDVVQDKYDMSREAFLDWVACGKPRSGAVFKRMSRLRASFKLSFRYCRQHVEQLRADACAKALDLHDPKKFWSNVYKVSNDKATKYASCVGGVAGDDSIANMWKDHFETLYNSVVDTGSKVNFYNRINAGASETHCYITTAQDVRDAAYKQKKGKSAGPDGLAMEAFIFGSNKLYIHLSLLFNLFLTHCHVPALFLQSVIVPLVKCKSGDLTDTNNYRAIALSNTVSKLLETIFLCEVNSVASCDAYQFGFKAGHSTGLCTNTLKSVVNYYTQQGSHVFICFVDFSKAFDKVNYWKLFNKLLDDSIDSSIVAMLAFWYSHQTSCVRWKAALSSNFTIGNGTRQGGILSPYLFTRYIRELIFAVVCCNVGCNIGGMYCNILAYADDIVLIAPSWAALQYLINLLDCCAVSIDMSCNIAKTVCMVFHPVCKRKVVASLFPSFTLGGQTLQFVTEFRYLGHIINNQFNDDDDVKREIRNLFMRTNILIRRYGKCSINVKTALFKAYCMCLYDAGIWRQYSVTVLNKLRSCYNKCVKIFFSYDRCYSVTQMLQELCLPSFDNLFLKCIGRFKARWSACTNTLVEHLNSLQV